MSYAYATRQTSFFESSAVSNYYTYKESNTRDLFVCIATKPGPGADGPSRFILPAYVQRKLAAACDCSHVFLS